MKKLFFAFYLLVTCVMQDLYSQLPGWNHFDYITIKENSGDTIDNYQLKLIINTQLPISLGQMNINGDDIRFGTDLNGGNLLSHWIESGMNSDSTFIWVKIDTLYANECKTIYMFYGNAVAISSSTIQGTFIGPQSATDSVSGANTGGVGNSQRGFLFSPNEDILVTSFGKNEPTGSTRYITLFDFATQAILVQTQVSGPAAYYSYGNLPNPLWLTQGTQYTLQMFQGASDGYYYGAAPQVGSHLTFYDMRYCNSCTQNTFPTNSLGGMHYGYSDFWYYTKKTVSPAPDYYFSGGPVTVDAGFDFSFCEGDSIVLNGSGADIFSWNLGVIDGEYFFPTSGNNYILTGTDTLTGCVGRDSVYVSMNGLPNIYAGSDQTICEGNTVTLNGSGGSFYNWSGGITNGIPFTPTLGTTNYIVTGTDSLTCSNSDTVSVTVINCTGIDNANEFNMNIYPNPASDVLYISGNFTEKLKIKILDIQGKVISQRVFNASSLVVLDISNLSNGLYQIELDINHLITRHPLIVNRK